MLIVLLPGFSARRSTRRAGLMGTFPRGQRKPRITPASDLLTLEFARYAILDPPNTAVGFFFPKLQLLLRVGHVPSWDNLSKYPQPLYVRNISSWGRQDRIFVNPSIYCISMVPGGGLEPPRPDKGLRILSPFLAILQGIAWGRIFSYKSPKMNRYKTSLTCTESHRVAQESAINSHQNSHQNSRQIGLTRHSLLSRPSS